MYGSIPSRGSTWSWCINRHSGQLLGAHTTVHDTRLSRILKVTYLVRFNSPERKVFRALDARAKLEAVTRWQPENCVLHNGWLNSLSFRRRFARTDSAIFYSGGSSRRLRKLLLRRGWHAPVMEWLCVYDDRALSPEVRVPLAVGRNLLISWAG